MVYNNADRKLNHREFGTCWLEFRPLTAEFVIDTPGMKFWN